MEQKAQFRSGDTIRVDYRIKEGDKERIQSFEGIVIAQKGAGEGKTFTVRRIGADGVGVERIFPYQSPFIRDIKVTNQAKARRSKLYYMRERVGKAAVKV